MWETVIGLEIHVQLNTTSKIFSASSTCFGAEPNTQANAIDLGLPGTLPTLNKEAVEKALLFGLAIDAEIPPYSIFARKNYFYPDLPKGYQTSQLDHPIVGRGTIEINLEDYNKVIGVTRAHLEEDAGKSIHDAFSEDTAIDLNRAGTPLLEVVSEPELRSAKEAVAYFKTIHTLATYLGICDGNLSQGSMRCDANVSIRHKGASKFGTRVEIKNLNSFKFVEQAIDHEVERQIDLLESGQAVLQETRLFDPLLQTTKAMRSKETANDYRYFPCPDLLPVMISGDQLEYLKMTLPELPQTRKTRFQTEFGLSEYDATLLTNEKPIADFFEDAIKKTAGGKSIAKLACNWINSEVMRRLNQDSLTIEKCPISAVDLGLLILRIQDNTLSSKMAKHVFDHMWNSGNSADDIIKQQGLQQMTDEGAVESIVRTVIEENPKQVKQFQEADETKRKKLIGFFVGQVMKQSSGKASPKQVNELLNKLLLIN